MLMRRTLWIAAALLTLVAPVSAGEALPHFGTGFVFLRQSNDGLFFIGHPSADGRYVVGTSNSPPVINTGDQLYLWDISTADPEGHPTEPEPIGAFDLQPWRDTLISAGSFALSPDSASVVLALDNQLLLLNTPDLSVRQAFELEDAAATYPADMVAWADDSQAAAAFYQNKVVVADVGSGKLYTRDISLEGFGTVTEYVSGYWVFGFETAFMVCTRYLESCTDYPLEEHLLQIYPETGTLLTNAPFGEGDYPTRVWHMNDDGVFNVTETLTSDGIIDGLNPNGDYITVRRMTEGGSPNFPYWSLYTRQPQTLVRQLEAGYRFLWLNDSGYFLVGASLYHISQPNTPIDDIPGLIDIGFAASDAEMNAKIAFYPENLGYLNPTADGRWFMWNLGGTAFMVPVVYPP